jgi:transposase InsO family protein
MPEEFVTTTLQRALPAQAPTPGLVAYSDQGGQYCGNAYRNLLHEHGSLRAQSRRGDYYDKAQAENRLQVLGAPGRGSKRKCLNCASGLLLPTRPMSRPASPTMLTTIITSACTRALTITRSITRLSNCFRPLP